MVFIIFSKIKRGFDREGKRAVALLATITLLCSFTGCSNGETPSPTDRNITSVGVSNSVNETGFDIDRVRKSIVIKGDKRLKFPLNLAKYQRVGATNYMTRRTFTFGIISSWQQCITTEMKCI